MTSLIGRLAAPAALMLLFGWRATGIWSGSEPTTVGAIRQPKAHVFAADLPKAMTFLWVRPLFAKPQSVMPILVNQTPRPDERSQPSSRLVGIVGDGENRVALMALDDRLVRSYKGSKVGPWTILGIDARSVMVERHGETTILYLDQKYLSK
jgi:hypothetical protein